MPPPPPPYSIFLLLVLFFFLVPHLRLLTPLPFSALTARPSSLLIPSRWPWRRRQPPLSSLSPLPMPSPYSLSLLPSLSPSLGEEDEDANTRSLPLYVKDLKYNKIWKASSQRTRGIERPQPLQELQEFPLTFLSSSSVSFSSTSK